MHPIAFDLGSLPIRWYGLMMALAFFAGLWTATRRARLANVSGEVIADVTLWLMGGSILGARFVYVTTYWKQEFADQPFREVFMIQHGGLVYYGGLIGATVFGVGYLLWKKLPVWKIADIIAPSIALGSVFGRIGCLLNGCCYGRACSLPWAIHFPAEHDTHGAGVHPTEIYDALLNFLLYLTLAWLFRRDWKSRMQDWGWKIEGEQRAKSPSSILHSPSSFADGQIFALYLIGYAICRSIVEFFRGDYPPDHIHAGFFTSAQLLSLPILVAGIALWFWFSRRSEAPPTAPVEKKG
ncbi:MAG TPA: prolipoprotein diacylglyceryl transferase [Verrucomicrobiae bacterium]